MLLLHAAGIAAVTIALLLGAWQYDAWQAGRDLAARDLAGQPALPLDDVLGPDDAFPNDRIGQPVDLAGFWLPESTLEIDGRTLEGVAGRWAVTPVAVCDEGALRRGVGDPGRPRLRRRRRPRPTGTDRAGRADRLAAAGRGVRTARPGPDRRRAAGAEDRQRRAARRHRPLRRLRHHRVAGQRHRGARRGDPRGTPARRTPRPRCATCSTPASGSCSVGSRCSCGGVGPATSSPGGDSGGARRADADPDAGRRHGTTHRATPSGQRRAQTLR